ncbi:MAG: hypothetical protein WC028_06015 [Candidatus Obscuribacterales bacterium]|jgi:hypothetical protein
MKIDAKQYTEPDTSKNELASGLLHRLCKHADTKVRLHLAENKHTPIELLVVLSYDSNPSVRLAVAENASAHHCLIERAVEDICVDVRYGLAENPHLPTHLLRKLAVDDNPYVACRAERTLARVLRECIALQCSRNSCLSS